MSWIKQIFGVEKPIIAMCHLRAMPGDPNYEPSKGITWVIDQALHDLLALQEGGVNGIMFSNESSLPYLTEAEPITVAVMARVIGELKHEIRIPYGVNVLWDPIRSIDLAVATEAQFVREIFTGVYASDFGLWNTNCGKTVRHRNALFGQHIRLLYNIVPEAAVYLGQRNIIDVARSTVFNAQPDGLCVSGLIAGAETSTSVIAEVKKSVPQTPVFANTGVNHANVCEQLSCADGAIIGTAFKRQGGIWNEVDIERVRSLMKLAFEFQRSIVEKV